MKHKDRIKQLFSELVDILIPDAQIEAVTPENTMPDPPQQDPVLRVKTPIKAEAILDIQFDESKVPEKLQRLASGTVKTFCPVCGMPMSGGTCRECEL